MRFGMVARRRFSLFDDTLDRAVRGGRIVNADQPSRKVEIGRTGLVVGIADEEPVRIDGIERGFDLLVELADRTEIDVEGFDRVLLPNDIVVVDLSGGAAAKKAVALARACIFLSATPRCPLCCSRNSWPGTANRSANY